MQRLQPQASKPSEASLLARGLALVYDPTLEAEKKSRQPKPDQALRIATSPFNADMSDMRYAAPLRRAIWRLIRPYISSAVDNNSCFSGIVILSMWQSTAHVQSNIKPILRFLEQPVGTLLHAPQESAHTSHN